MSSEVLRWRLARLYKKWRARHSPACLAPPATRADPDGRAGPARRTVALHVPRKSLPPTPPAARRAPEKLPRCSAREWPIHLPIMVLRPGGSSGRWWEPGLLWFGEDVVPEARDQRRPGYRRGRTRARIPRLRRPGGCG